MRPLPNRSRKYVLFVTELLQSLGNGHANERQPRRSRSQQREIDLGKANLVVRPHFDRGRFHRYLATKSCSRNFRMAGAPFTNNSASFKRTECGCKAEAARAAAA